MVSFKRKKKHDGDGPSAAQEVQKTKNKVSLASKLPGSKQKNRFVLVMGDDGAILVFIKAGKVQRRLFAPSAEMEHIKPMLELLEKNPTIPFYLLCDMIDQSYVRHTLPPVSPLSIRKLVKRRLERDFSPEDIKGSLPLGRDTTGRKEWNFLLISLANSSMLQQWLDAFMEMPNQFMGIYLLPVESQEFIAALSAKITASGDGKESAWKILVAHDKVAGFRQVVLKKGQLIFTRLTQDSGASSPEVTAGNVEQEILNTIEYLRRLEYNEQAGLDVVIIAAQDIKDLIDITKLGATHANLLTPFEVAQILGLEQAALSGDRFADVVLAASFGILQKPRLKLSPSYGKKLDQLYQARLGVKIFAGVACTWLLISIGSSVMGWLSTSGSVKDIKKEILAAEASLVQSQQQFSELGKDQNKLMRISALYKAIPTSVAQPTDFIRRFAAIRNSRVIVRSWNWNANYTQKVIDPNNPQPANQEAPAVRFDIALQLEFTDHENNRNVLAEKVEAFTARLSEAYPNYKVEHDPLPGAQTEDQRLVVNFDDANSAADSNLLQPGENIIGVRLNGPLSEQERNPPENG